MVGHMRWEFAQSLSPNMSQLFADSIHGLQMMSLMMCLAALMVVKMVKHVPTRSLVCWVMIPYDTHTCVGLFIQNDATQDIPGPEVCHGFGMGSSVHN